ncbi:MAG: AAA family ATPase [Bacteroidota bacterium]
MDKEYLKTVGKIWTEKDVPSNIIENDLIVDSVEAIHSLLTNPSPKSVLISGDKGVGKSTIIDLVCKKLESQNWFIFKATAGNVMAGQRYIGDLEQSVQNVLAELTSTKKCLWLVPRFQELYYGGRHQYSPVSILDQILPFIETGELKIIGELDSNSLEKILQFRPQITSSFEIFRINSVPKEVTLGLARQWIEHDNGDGFWEDFTPDDLEEVYYLSNQYLSHKENPGRVLDLAKQTRKLVESKKEKPSKITLPDFIDSLTNITGLPKTILDDSEKLNLEDLRQYFATRVLGQEDAVNTIIERIAMIKAGLTDPSKPSGVFLFVGPTGTGKTEIAKSIAEYLFGSEDRLVRLDMSEFQTQESTYKLLGDSTDTAESSALVNIIRRKPFSIVLLDEFEKAHPNIWDIFLQVFDDGRLTDQRGNVADFRHSIIILTSNIGASLPQGNRVGFNNSGEHDMDTNMMKSIHYTFRPEFINRIDKIVMFNPLSKAIAKQILKNELGKVLQRRGLRRRAWELDFEDSALEFLLEQGFSSTLGARPLKRVIEKYLLAPLALTIVNHNYPKGNQFLLVSPGKQKLKVQFIDPDEPDFTWEQKKQILERQKTKSEHLRLTDILLDSKGVLSEFKLIQRKLNELTQKMEDKALIPTKDDLMLAMGSNDFWSNPERYEVLTQIEFIDRFESGYDTATRLLDRLDNPEKERLSYDPKLIKKLAQRVYLLDKAISSYAKGEPQDAILKIAYSDANRTHGKKMEHMYRSWAKMRGMKMETLEESHTFDDIHVIFSIVGFGAYGILNKETGYHIIEESGTGEKQIVKSKILVSVIPMELEDYRLKEVPPIIQRFKKSSVPKNVRRYKFGKSPIVKDFVSSWQTGKLDKVLKGDFDLFA